MDDVDIVPVLIQKGTTNVCSLLCAGSVHALPPHGLRIPFACVGSVYRHTCVLVAMYVCVLIFVPVVCFLRNAVFTTAGYRRLHPIVQCAVNALNGLACRAPVLLAHAEVAKT